jgi:GT2 family glycosyltransferase
MLPTFAILILNYNGSRWLRGLYDSLRNDGYGSKRVYLIDNGSTDGSQQFTREQYPEVTILQMPRNMGYCMAYNLATQIAFADGCNWAILQNNDTLVVPGWLDSMGAAAAGDARIGVMGPVFRDWTKDGPNYFMQARHPDIVPFMEDGARMPVDCDWVEGSAFAVKRECIEDVGPLEPDLFIYWEETDFCRRAIYRGWRVVIVPGAVARHYGGGDTSSGAVPAVNFNALKTHNNYVYVFCDPNLSFARNLFNAFYLYLVNLKAALRSSNPLGVGWKATKVYGSFLARLPKWRAKWARDRRGIHPPAFQKGFELTTRDLLPQD